MFSRLLLCCFFLCRLVGKSLHHTQAPLRSSGLSCKSFSFCQQNWFHFLFSFHIWLWWPWHIWISNSYVLSFSLGAGPVPALLLPEIFASRIRAKAISLSLGTHWVSDFILESNIYTIFFHLAVNFEASWTRCDYS